mmetsp:Transcript_5930/g.8426  ORF Transcript_5930/g.8426 Transcript_5930/m.8426 type:complete len:288 (+) Transcript_5930:144-1007(+)
MPSRKKAQGKARKAARADKAKEAASVPPKDFTEVTLDSWLTCDDESEKCKHGCDLSLPKSEHDCRDFAMRYAKDFLIEICRAFGNEQLLKNMFTSNDFVGQCMQKFKSFVASIDDMEENYPEVFESPSKLKWAISFYHSRGTQDVINGNMKRAQHAAICATLMNGYLSDLSDVSTMKLYDIMQSNDKMILTYFRKRISCSCLDETRKEYKGVKKTGKCCNDQCPLPGRVAERSSLLYCTACKFVQYCSAECQKVNWKYHKHQCTSIAKLNSIDYEYVQNIAQVNLLL